MGITGGSHFEIRAIGLVVVGIEASEPVAEPDGDVGGVRDAEFGNTDFGQQSFM